MSTRRAHEAAGRRETEAEEGDAHDDSVDSEAVGEPSLAQTLGSIQEELADGLGRMRGVVGPF